MAKTMPLPEELHEDVKCWHAAKVAARNMAESAQEAFEDAARMEYDLWQAIHRAVPEVEKPCRLSVGKLELVWEEDTPSQREEIERVMRGMEDDNG